MLYRTKLFVEIILSDTINNAIEELRNRYFVLNNVYTAV